MPTNPITFHTNKRPCGCELQMRTEYEFTTGQAVATSQVLVHSAIAANKNNMVLNTTFCDAHSHFNFVEETPMDTVNITLSEYDAANDLTW
jgi:hypothetical protein